MRHCQFISGLLALLVVFASLASAASPQDLVLLKDLAARYGFPSVTETPRDVDWKSQYSSLTFRTKTRRLIFNGRLFWLNGAVTPSGKTWAITRTDADTVIRPLLQSGSVLQKQGYSLVVLDPGHGGSDTGTIGHRRVYEKKVVLDITKRVKRKLNASNVAVRMTRTRDKALTLADRPKLAAKWGADAFISIHANSASRKSAQGVETFVMPAAGFPSTTSVTPDKKTYPGNRHDAANTLLAGFVQQGLVAHTQTPDRGVKRARFAVLREAKCPAALVEVGFLSNATEASKLIDAAYRDAVAEGIAQGILTYLVKTEASQ
jgi:N-acetylmuramoyl-L-alanine amidase